MLRLPTGTLVGPCASATGSTFIVSLIVGNDDPQFMCGIDLHKDRNIKIEDGAYSAEMWNVLWHAR